MKDSMECRPGCGACCIAPSISSPIPGMPKGKAAGERCVHLNDDYLCALFGQAERPAVCGSFKADPLICTEERESALRLLTWLEQATTA